MNKQTGIDKKTTELNQLVRTLTDKQNKNWKKYGKLKNWK